MFPCKKNAHILSTGDLLKLKTMKIKLIEKDEYIIKYEKIFDEIQHEYSETLYDELKFEFRLKYLKADEEICNLHAYRVVVNEFDIDTL